MGRRFQGVISIFEGFPGGGVFLRGCFPGVTPRIVDKLYLEEMNLVNLSINKHV